MRAIILPFLAAVVLASTAFGGGEVDSSKETRTTPQPFCDWYANREWNASVWGTYAFSGNEWRDDTFLNVDHAWGGGADFKYFFARYFGLGLEGFLLDGRDTAGGALGTLTFRYSVPSSRIAPYLYAGAGGVFGNDNFFDHRFLGRHDDNSKAVGQFGGGVEFRITPNIGVIQDFNWNVVNGNDNNFGMVRAGINFAF
jgi:hypothetical protein